MSKEVSSMKRTLGLLFALALIAVSCGNSYDEQKEIEKAEQLRLWREDSAAFKVGVVPTLDCLPMFVAQQYSMFDSAGVDIRLKYFNSNIDCDTAIANGYLQGMVSDLIRCAKIKDKYGVEMECPIMTNGQWSLIGNRNVRIKTLKHLDDKMVAVTRHSLLEMMVDKAIDSAALDPERVYKVQINDINLRLMMLKNNEIDAVILPEPQATEALTMKNVKLANSDKLGFIMGCVAFNKAQITDSVRGCQLSAFIEIYDRAVDSINKNGLSYYGDLIKQQYGVGQATVDTLPKKYKLPHATAATQEQLDMARKWYLEKKQKDYEF